MRYKVVQCTKDKEITLNEFESKDDSTARMSLWAYQEDSDDVLKLYKYVDDLFCDWIKVLT